MTLLRTLPTRRLLPLLAAVAVLAIGVATVAVAAARSGGPTPEPKPLGQALHDAVSSPRPDGLTARITFTNHLFPTGSLTGEFGSALMSGASGRLWVTNDGLGRLELQSNAGDVQIVWSRRLVTVYDASSNTVYRAEVPQQAKETPHAQEPPPSVAQIENLLSTLGEHALIVGAEPTSVAGRSAYSLRVSPRDGSSLLGAAELAWDAARGVPLRVGVYAKGASTPTLELAATDISFGSVARSDVAITPPPGATVVDLTPTGTSEGGTDAKDRHAVTGLAPVQSAANFPVTAPATLGGRQREEVRLVHGNAMVVYGDNLGAIVLVERKAGSGGLTGRLGALPTVSLDGATAHELAMPLATALAWQRAGVGYLLAGSVPPAVAENAARELG
jgi:outer membrane lipoprotein-sorting protein